MVGLDTVRHGHTMADGQEIDFRMEGSRGPNGNPDIYEVAILRKVSNPRTIGFSIKFSLPIGIKFRRFKYIIMIKHLFVALTLLLTGCSVRIQTVNENEFTEFSYLESGKNNRVKIKGKKIDSISNGSFERINRKLYLIKTKESLSPEKVWIYTKKKLLGGVDSICLIVSKPPSYETKLFPMEIIDSIHFDNLRFLKYKLVPDSNSFDNQTKNVDIVYLHLDSVSHSIGSDGFDHHMIANLFEDKPNKIYIDSIRYKSNSIVESEIINKTLIIDYPEYNLYSKLDSTKSFWNIAFKSIVFLNVGLKSDIDSLSEVLYFGAHNSEGVRYPYEDHYFMNMGGLNGLNRIVVKNKLGETLFDRVINGMNHRIEDLFDSYGYDEIFVTVRGDYHWDIHIIFV